MGSATPCPKTESNELFERWAIPSPGKALFEDASANFSSHSPARVNTGNTARGPLLLVAGGKDHTVPAAITRSTLKQYRHSGAVTDFKEFSDRGHTLALDSRWSEVADYVLSWLKKHSL